MIKVTVRMFSSFMKYLPPERTRDTCVINLEDNVTVIQLLNQLHVPKDIPKVITVNDENQKEYYILQDNDLLKIFPIARGG